jgi:hypothetical protein
MTYTFRPARRENVPLLLGVAGGTGSGKTYSALLLARGLANGQPFAIVDTENGRAKHYADLFPEMRHAEIHAPFRPDKYAEAIEAADTQTYPVVVVDSMSHEWAGDGGCIDWHDDIMGRDQSKNFSAWIEPKKAHKRMVTRLLQVNAHVILCFRAEPKVEVIDDPERPGRKKYIEKRSLTGLDGWIPISEKMLPYELTASFLLMADHPGVPKPIKLQEQHKPFVPLDRPLDENVGRALAEWASGSAPGMVRGESQAGAETSERVTTRGRVDSHTASPRSDSSSVGEPQAGHSEVLAMHTSVSQAAERTEPASPTDILDLITAIVMVSNDPRSAQAAINSHAAEHTPEEHLAYLREIAARPDYAPKIAALAGGAS